MTSSDWKAAVDLLRKFEANDIRLPAESEKLIAQILRACGHDVRETGFIQGDTGVDCYFDTDIDGSRQRIAVEVKTARQPAGLPSVQQALGLHETGQFSRAMVVSKSGFTADAVRLATEQGAGKIDLLSPRDLRNWLEKHAPQAAPDKTADFIIRHAMKALARLIAQNPEQLVAVEWRDLERILREVFEGLGFDTRLTRPAKDGGFDLELVTSVSGEKRTYLVEVKHWTEKRPGLPHLQRFVHITTSAKATTGLLLSTSGFTRTLYEGFAKITAPVRLGDGEKIVSLCKAYYRLESALWLEARDCEEMLLGGTLQAATDPWGARRET